MTRWIAVIIIAMAVALDAMAKPPVGVGPDWAATCDVQGRRFTVHFKSPSGDAAEDDMVVELHGLAHVPTNLPVAPKLYVPSTTLPNVKNLCDRVVGLALGPERILLVLQYDGRPFNDHIGLVLLDSRSGRALFTHQDVGKLKFNELVMRPVDAGTFDVRVIRETLADTCDCNQALIEDWMRIRISDDALSVGWAPR